MHIHFHKYIYFLVYEYAPTMTTGIRPVDKYSLYEKEFILSKRYLPNRVKDTKESTLTYEHTYLKSKQLLVCISEMHRVALDEWQKPKKNTKTEKKIGSWWRGNFFRFPHKNRMYAEKIMKCYLTWWHFYLLQMCDEFLV